MSRPIGHALPLAYEQVRQELRQRLGKQWRPGTRLPPIKELARLLGTGQTSTHRAVKELAAEGLLVSRPGRGTFVCGASSALGQDQAITLGAPLAGKRICLFHSTVDQMTQNAVDVLLDELADAGGLSDTVRPRFGDIHELLAARRNADAVILINGSYQSPLDIPENQLVVVIDTGIVESLAISHDHYDIVSVDSEQGGFLVGRWMRRIECNGVAFVGCPSSDGRYDLTSSARLRGFEHGWGEAIKAERQLKVAKYVPDHGARAFAKYLAMEDRPEGVFCASDDLAVGFVHGGMAHGMEAGRDFQLVGFDGQIRGQELVGGPMTTVKAPMDQMGHSAVELLIQRFGDRDRQVRRMFLGCSLIKGATTRTPAGEAGADAG